jgi:predicted nucleotidyltransferase
VPRPQAPCDVRVFGSVARGEDGPDSDVDFLVRFVRGTTLFDQAGLIVELEHLLGRNVDVVSERGLKERIRDRVLGEATPL